MGSVVAEFTMSLDGFIAGPNDDIGPLFGWYGSGDTEFVVPNSPMVFKVARASAQLLQETWSQIGAIVTGRRDFDVSNAWGGVPVLGVPTFIVTHHVPSEWAGPDSPFTFVTAGVAAAVAQAQAAAGAKVVGIGGTTIVQQCLQAGLLDEIQLHLAPILLGSGTRLFANLESMQIALEQLQAIQTPDVTHLRYRVKR